MQSDIFFMNFLFYFLRRQVEEKFGFCDLESPFTNISIPRIESYFSAEGSQQILYCIQFDDVEQRGVYTFETTCTTTRRRYSDFVQLHASLEEVFFKLCLTITFFYY